MANSRLCSIEGCGKKHFGLGFCQSHHFRFKKYGDPFGGRTPNGEARLFTHDVAIPYDGDECLIWPFVKNNQGYGQVIIDGKRWVASRYICEIIRGAPPTQKHEAAHNCGNGNLGCVNPNHLEWKTPSQNQMDRVDHGTHTRGERQPNSKLTESQVLEIRNLVGTVSPRELAERYGVTSSTISHINCGKTWSWL